HIRGRPSSLAGHPRGPFRRFALILVTRRPALERAHMHPQHLSRLLLCDLAPLLPIQQTRKTHPTHTLVHRCRAHRALFVPGTKNTTLHELQTGDRSRANYTSSLSRFPPNPDHARLGSSDQREGSKMRRRERLPWGRTRSKLNPLPDRRALE